MRFLLLGFFISSIGIAQAQTPVKPPLAPVPAPATDEVKREIKDCTTYDGTKYKVVPASSDTNCNPTPAPTPKPKPKPTPKPKPKPKPCPACPTCPPPQVVEKEKVVEKVTYKTWRVYGLVGYGQHGLKSSPNTDGEQVDKYYGPIYGGGVDYHVNENWSVGVQGLSNEQGALSIGYSFGNN